MTHGLAGLVEHVEHFQARIIREAIRDAEGAAWERRAAMLEWARPRPGDWHGRATPAELRARYDRLTEEAAACRNRARISLIGGEPAWDLEPTQRAS